MISYYLQSPGGASVVGNALFGTAAVFLSLSAYVLTTKKDFSFMGQMLMAGILVAFVASIGVLIASLFGFYWQPLGLAISALFTILMCGLILYQTGEIVNGGETNYILATTTLYLSIYNLFTSLLHILGVSMGED